MAGLSFSNPLWLAALPLPLLWALLVRKRPRSGVPLPTLGSLETLGARDRSALLLIGMRALALGLLVVAMAGPRGPGRWVTDRRSGVDLMLALDISGSMAAEDLAPDRVSAAKAVLSDFIARNRDQRLGLVVFKARALTVCPLTADTDEVASALAGVDLTTLKDDGTAIGDAIGTCLNRLAPSTEGPQAGFGKVIVLLTDGENNSGMLSPLEAAAIARSRGVKIDAIAVGKPGGAPVPILDALGQRTYVHNPDGSLYLTTIDETTLQKIAKITGGLYFRAGDTAGLEAAYRQISRLTRHEIDSRRHEAHDDLSSWPLALALALVALAFGLENGRWRTMSARAPGVGLMHDNPGGSISWLRSRSSSTDPAGGKA